MLDCVHWVPRRAHMHMHMHMLRVTWLVVRSAMTFHASRCGPVARPRIWLLLFLLCCSAIGTSNAGSHPGNAFRVADPVSVRRARWRGAAAAVPGFAPGSTNTQRPRARPIICSWVVVE